MDKPSRDYLDLVHQELNEQLGVNLEGYVMRNGTQEPLKGGAYLESLIYALLPRDRLRLKQYQEETGVDGNKPFLKQALDVYPSKETFILANFMCPNDEEQGLTPEQILTSPFLYLIHGTCASSLEKILLSGKLIPGHRLSRTLEDQYPGIYTQPVEGVDFDVAWSGNEVVIVLSLALLRKRAWHINKDRYRGNIDGLTWDYLTLPEYLISHYSDFTRPFSEMVFHDEIPIEYIEAIVITREVDDEDIDGIYKLGEQYDVPVYLQEEWSAVRGKAIKGLYSEGSYTNDPPNFCYDNMGTNEPASVLPLSNIRATLLNSGFSLKETENLLKLGRPTLLKFLRELWTSRLKTGEKYAPLIHPPY